MLSALEFNGSSIKYWDIYCNNNNDDQTIAAQYEVTFDGTKVTKKVGEILNDAKEEDKEEVAQMSKAIIKHRQKNKNLLKYN